MGVWLYALGAFVVNIGDMLELWTNGLFKATPHRVVRPLDRSRLSIPFFFEPNYDAVVHPIAELAPPGVASRLPVIYGEHLFAKTSSNFDFDNFIATDGAEPLTGGVGAKL